MFAFNQLIAEGMTGYASAVQNQRIGNIHIREVAFKESKKNNRLILKVDKQDNLPNALTTQFNVTMHGANYVGN